MLSNTGYTRGVTLRKILDKLEIGNYFSFQLYSDEHESSKPSPEFYSIMIDNLKKIPGKDSLLNHEILHIGDNVNADVEGARKMGMKSILYHPEKNNLSTIFS